MIIDPFYIEIIVFNPIRTGGVIEYISGLFLRFFCLLCKIYYDDPSLTFPTTLCCGCHMKKITFKIWFYLHSEELFGHHVNLFFVFYLLFIRSLKLIILKKSCDIGELFLAFFANNLFFLKFDFTPCLPNKLE